MFSLNAAHRADPSRTGLLRRAFMADMAKRIAALVDDIEGLSIFQQPSVTANALGERWRFATDAAKLESFKAWFQDRVQRRLLSPVGGRNKEPWSSKYVASAYKKGLLRAYADLRRGTLMGGDFYEGGQEEFLRSSFGSPEAAGKLKLLNTRTYTYLKGLSEELQTTVGRVLADGLADGHHPKRIARDLTEQVKTIGRTRARTIARTEVIHAHSEGQLDAFEDLGLSEVELMVEWSTSGNGNVCEKCQPLQGIVLTTKDARGLIPRHPNCACAFVPALSEYKQTGQVWDRRRVSARISQSAKAEHPKAKTAAEARRRSLWPGADVRPKGAKK